MCVFKPSTVGNLMYDSPEVNNKNSGKWKVFKVVAAKSSCYQGLPRSSVQSQRKASLITQSHYSSNITFTPSVLVFLFTKSFPSAYKHLVNFPIFKTPFLNASSSTSYFLVLNFSLKQVLSIQSLILPFLLSTQTTVSGFSSDTAHQVTYLNVRFSVLILLDLLIRVGVNGYSPYIFFSLLPRQHALLVSFPSSFSVSFSFFSSFPNICMLKYQHPTLCPFTDEKKNVVHWPHEFKYPIVWGLPKL